MIPRTPEPSNGDVGAAEQACSPTRRDLLAVASFPVHPVVDGATLRISELLRQLSTDWSIRLVAPPAPDGFDTAAIGVSSFTPVTLEGRYTYKPFHYDTSPLIEAVRAELQLRQPSVALLWSGSEFLGLEEVELPPVVADRIDCASLTAWRALIQAKGWRERAGRAKHFLQVLRYERQVAKVPRSTVVVGEDDARWLRAIGVPSVSVISNGVDVSPEPPQVQEATRPTVVFSGVMNYAPNIDAAEYFAREIWPLVMRRTPEAEFVIVGRSPESEIVELGEIPGVRVTGEVADLRSVLRTSWVAVAPMKSGSGVKNKVLEAWAEATPVVFTSLATNGLRGIEAFDGLVADDPGSLAERVLLLLNDAEERRRRGLLAHRAARSQSWRAAGRAVSDLLDRVAS